MAHILITGATGFVGGEFLSQIYPLTEAHHTMTVVVRSAEQKLALLSKYSRLIVAVGDLNDTIFVKALAHDADVVLNLASTSNMACAQAIADGLHLQGYWIQISGASMFSLPDIEAHSYGELRDNVFDDLQDADSIREIILGNPKRLVDQLVLKSSHLKSALIVAPLIYGDGHGPGNTRSIQVPEMIKAFLERGRGFQVGAGLSVWSNVHISDLGALLCRLTLSAVQGSGEWATSSIFTPENGRMAFGELARSVAAEAYQQGLLNSAEISESLTAEQANAIMPAGAVFWGTNAITAESTARKLGWQPSNVSLQETLSASVRREAQSVVV